MTTFTWIKIFAALFQLISSAAGSCSDTPVGVRDELKVIPDDDMTAGSALTGFPAKHGRLAGTGAWCPQTNGDDSLLYLQISLGKSYVICGVEVQGKPNALESTNFTLQSSTNGSAFTAIDSGKTFNAPSAGGDVATFHTLTTNVTATHLRFIPVSNLTCLRVEIYAVPENVAVTCQTSNILVAIQKSLFTDSDASFAATDLALNDRKCKATNGSTTFDFDITLGTCNTKLTISKDEERSFYHNMVFNTAENETEFNIICSYVRTPTTASSSGALTFTMNIYQDENHQNLVTNEVIDLGQKLYFKIEVQTTSSDIELHLTQCKATSTDNVNDANNYTFIQSGCHVQSDQFVTDYNCSATPNNSQTFTLSAFRFAGRSAGDRVYFHCNALACLISNTASTCATQCGACTSKRKRRNLQLEEQDPNEVHLVLGPFTIVEEGDTTKPNEADENDGVEDSNTIQKDSENFPTTKVVIVCVGAIVVLAIIVGLVVMTRFSKSARGPAVKNVTADLSQVNAAFDDTEVKTLSVKSI